MNKRMREILALIDEKMNAAKDFKDGNTNKGIEKDLDKAVALMAEIKELEKEYKLEKEMYEMDKAENEPTPEQAEKAIKENKQDDAVKKFLRAARAGFPKTTMTEGTDADGGYTVPEDIRTQIEKYRDAKFSLRQLVRVNNVTTKSGAYTFKARADQTGFSEIAEGGNVGAAATPKFERVSWTIKKYGGYLPVTNELLRDSDANIVNTVVEWMGDEARVTDNKNILAVMKTFTAKTLTADGILDELKTIINVDLGQAFAGTVSIVTNDNGLNILDALKDANGLPLLTPNPQDAMKKQIRAGANVIPLVVVPNADLPNDTTKIPFFVGDMREAIDLRDRQAMEIISSNTAVVGTLNAFEDDLNIWRGILREGVVKRDAKALYYATLNTAGN